MSRFSIPLFSCVTIPILTALAYIDGTKVVRQELPHWRDGVGLTAIVIVSVNWLFQVLLWILSSISFDLTRFYNPDWFALQMYTSLAATLLGNRTEEGSETPRDYRGPCDAGILARIRLHLMD